MRRPAMAIRIDIPEEIDRRVPVVFEFYAVNHVRNHPSWDPFIELWLDSDAPIGVGTVIRKRNTRSGTPVDGTMEVVEFEPNRSMGVITREGAMEIRGRATVEEAGEGRTRLTFLVDMPIEQSMRAQVEGSMRRSLQNIKQLVESEP
jgi:Polyketide cyclase / dehydrase and lipid transport